LVDAERDGALPCQPFYTLDQSHAVTDPIESAAAGSSRIRFLGTSSPAN
jgi:L-rhamnose isomerase